ncbi:sensor histidine kinase [Nesterenkonia muleiensis]|uniref:sensor histidine kinase n=1 Tax=Nesterenkonia muleiensis TaxID=2282648 RepID=UPI000E71B86B|nr:histidine kinase [Nesterenkonia muleiensis]
MPASARQLVSTVVEDFESGGFWSCRDLNKWLLVVVTLVFGIALGVDVFYEVLISERSPLGLIVAGVISVGCVILLWVCVTYAVAAGLGILIMALFADGIAYWVVFALLLVGLAAVTTTKPFRRGALAVVILWAGALGATVADATAGTFLFLGVSLGLLVAYGIGASFRQATHARLQSARDLEEAQELHRRAKAAERKSIARDLHDIVAHDITIIAMQSRAARMQDTDEAYREAVTIIGDSSRAALNDLRRMLALLKDEKIVDDDTGPLSSASELDIRRGVEAFADRLESLGITTHRVCGGDLDTISRSVSAALYRMLQECTTNVAKYGGEGATCWITIDVGSEYVEMRVTNTVQKTSPRAVSWGTSETGLIGVGDRAQAFGGACDAGSDAQGRWHVRITGVKKA